MPRFFEVRLSVIAVVEAVDEADASDAALYDWRDIWGDCFQGVDNVSVTREIKALSDLRHGWDGMCLPYGGDGGTRLNELLKA